MNDTIKLELHHLLRSTLRKAVKQCNAEKKCSLVVISENPAGLNRVVFEIQSTTDNPMEFYYLGQRMAQLV